jgi:hypothetical protein
VGGGREPRGSGRLQVHTSNFEMHNHLGWAFPDGKRFVVPLGRATRPWFHPTSSSAEKDLATGR